MNEYIDRDALRQAVLESQHDNPHPRGMAHIIHDCEHAHFVAMIARFLDLRRALKGVTL